MSEYTQDQNLRHDALAFAANVSYQSGPDAVMSSANKFYTFLKGGPTPNEIRTALHLSTLPTTAGL